MSFLFLIFQLVLLFSVGVLTSSLIKWHKLYILSTLIFSILLCFQISSIYLGGNLVDYKFFMHCTLKNIKSVINFYYLQIVLLVAVLATFTSLILWLSIKISKIRKKNKKYIYTTIIIFFLLMFIPRGILGNIVSVIEITNSSEKDFISALESLGINHDLYIEPNSVEAQKGKNIIVISLESFEKGYLNDNLADLTPNLRKLAEDNTIYDMSEDYGSSWTAASIYTEITGMPAYFKGFGNEVFQNTKSNKITGIGQVLKKAGYNLTYLMGNPEFSGLSDILQSYSFNVKSEKTSVNNYKTTMWGLQDFDLFAEAKNEILLNKKLNAPFALFLSTNSTHSPDGIYDERMEGLVNKQQSNLEFMVASVDYLIADFIKFLKDEDVLSNTVLFFLPDHLLMGQEIKEIKESNIPRSLFLLTTADKGKLNTKTSQKIDQIDLPKIILEGAEVKHNAKFLTDYINTENKINFIKGNINNIVALNESSLKVNDSSDGALIKLEENGKVEINIGGHNCIINKNDSINSDVQIFECAFRMIYNTGLLPFTLDNVIHYNTSFSNISEYKFNKDFLYLVFYENAGKPISYIQKAEKKSIGKFEDNSIRFSKRDINSFLESDSIYIKSTSTGNVDISVPSSNRILNFSYPTTPGLILLFRDNANYLAESYNTYNDSIAAESLVNKLKELTRGKSFFILVKKDSCDKYLKNYKKELTKYGLEDLARIKNNEVYISYLYRGFVSEFKSENSLSLIMPVNPSVSLRTEKQINRDAKDVNRFIAHAGGAIEGNNYTNSLEALNSSYKKGFRFFELDIIKTSDDVYVAAHDWEHWSSITEYKGIVPVSSAEFLNHKILWKYTPLDMKSINEWFKSHSDAILVTDKINEPKNFSNQFIDKHRLMMELFSIDAVKEGLLSGIRTSMPSENVVFGITGDKVKFLKELGVKYIATSRRLLEPYRSFFVDLQKNDIKVYVFNVNNDIWKDEAYSVCNDLDYAYGLYADDWAF